MRATSNPPESNRINGRRQIVPGSVTTCRATVMLMTDEPQLRQSLRQSLEQSGYCVVDDIPASASDRQIPACLKLDNSARTSPHFSPASVSTPPQIGPFCGAPLASQYIAAIPANASNLPKKSNTLPARRTEVHAFLRTKPTRLFSVPVRNPPAHPWFSN